MVRVSRFVAVLVVGVAFSASCKKAELGDPTPTGITVQVDSSSITADDGSVVVRAQVFEDGIALLGEGVTFSIDGTISQPTILVPTDPTTGVAEHTFTNLRTVGSGNVIVSAGATAAPVTASAPLGVTPGVPATVTVDAGGTATADQGSTVIAVAATDAFTNAVPTAAINLSTNAPGAVIVNNALQNLRVAGNWSLIASVAGFPAVLATDGYIVTAGAPAQAKASLGQSVVGRLQTLDIYCEEQDQYGNLTGAPYTATTQVFTTPASTIASLGDGHFTASGFTVTGPATAHCDKGAVDDSKGFQVVAQTSANTVVANLDRSVVEAGMSATLTCRELDQFGNVTATTFTNVTTTATGATVIGSGNTFTLLNLLVKGTFSATCTSPAAASNSDQFAVVDTTAPIITAFSITLAGTPHNGGLDGRHGPDEEITVTMTATDAVGLSRQEIGALAGGSVVTTANPVLHPAATTASTLTFKVQLDPAAATFSSIVLRGQAADTTGNTSTFAGDITITVDPGAGIAVLEPGIVIRTHWEAPGFTFLPIAVVSSGANFYVKSIDFDPASDEIRRITVGGTATTTVGADFIAGLDDNSSIGFVQVPGSFGGRNLFHSLVGGTSGQIAAFTGSTPGAFTLDPIAPRDMSFGTVGGNTGLFHYDDGGAFGTIFRVDSTGASFPFFIDSAGELAGAGGVAVLGDAVFVGAGTKIFRVAGSPAVATNFIGGIASDLCASGGANLLAVDSATGLYRIGTSPASDTALSTGFTQAAGCTVDAAGAAYVLDSPPGITEQPSRLYRVTGF